MIINLPQAALFFLAIAGIGHPIRALADVAVATVRIAPNSATDGEQSAVVTPVTAFADPPLPPDAALPVIDWKDAAKFVGRTVIVQGRVVATRNTGAICFLNFDDPRIRTFVALIRKPSFAAFAKPPEETYRDKIVRVRGMVTEYRGNYEIEITSPSQIEVLEREGPLTSQPAPRIFDGRITLATFNTLNLFDEYDDPYRTDEGTPAKPRQQIEALARTIRSLDADVLALQEVENRGVLERFVGAMLPDMGYEHVVLFEGNDQRGIDCALLSRLPVGPVTSHRHLRFDDGSGRKIGFQRDLLQVRIDPPGCPSLTVFVVHLKSKRGEADVSLALREAEALQIRRILDDILRADPTARFVICGDFNDTQDSAPIRLIVGAGATRLVTFVSDMPGDTPTYNVARYRSMIDFLYCSPALAACYLPNTFRIHAGSIESNGSDHNPVAARFQVCGATSGPADSESVTSRPSSAPDAEKTPASGAATGVPARTTESSEKNDNRR